MISGVVHTALTGLVGGRIYANTFAQPNTNLPPTWPAIRYTIVNSDPTPDLCGTTDVTLDDVRVQLDVVSLTYGATAVLRDQVVAAMMNLDPPAVRQPSGFETYDSDTRTHRVVLEYVFYPSSALIGSPAVVGSPP